MKRKMMPIKCKACGREFLSRFHSFKAEDGTTVEVPERDYCRRCENRMRQIEQREKRSVLKHAHRVRVVPEEDVRKFIQVQSRKMLHKERK